MQTYDYPEEYKNRIEAECKKKVQELQANRDRQIQALNQQKAGEIAEINKNKKALSYGGDNEIVVSVLLGMVLGGVAFLYTCSTQESLFGWLILPFIIWGIVWAITSFVIGGIITSVQGSKNKQKESYNQNIEAEISEIEEKYKEKIAAVNKTCEEACIACERAHAMAIQEQQKEFDYAVQQQSIRFANSALAKEIIEWMTGGFCKMIDSADRREHIQRLNIPFNFQVFTNKITCNLGTYDFELHRCDNLNYVEMAALAKSLATSIELNIRMKYLQDVSGTPIEVEMSNTMSSGYGVHCNTTITYRAYNGYYRNTTNW